MRKIITYFIKYPISTDVLIFGFVVFGYFSMMNMGASFFPLIDNRNITIQVVYPGASPEEVEEGIIMKIEDNLRGVTGIERFTSKSSENRGSITVEVFKGFNPEEAYRNVKNSVDQISSFPVDMEPIVVSKDENVNPAMGFAISGENISLKSLKQIARKVEDDLRVLGGISKINLSGFPEEEIEIAVDETKLRAFDLSFDQVANAVKKANIDITGGTIKGKQEEYLIRGRAKEYYAHDLDNILVKSDKFGRSVRLRDIASVTDRWSDSPNEVEINHVKSVDVTILTTDDEDLLGVAEKVKDYIADFNETHDGVSIIITQDMSFVLNARKQLLVDNGISGVILVLLFLSLFLNPRMAFWVSAGFPVSFLGMFIFAHLSGVTINIISLFGMIVVIGILVDDGIVIAENVYHHYEKGKNPVQAAIDGTMEVVPAIMSAVLTTIIAFSSFFFLDGKMADFFGELAFVVIATLGISLIEALIILPTHLAHSKALVGKRKDNVVTRTFDKLMFWMRDKTYIPALTYLLKNKALTFTIIISIFFLSIAAIFGGVVGVTFFPSMERSNIAISLKLPAGTKSELTKDWLLKIQSAAEETNRHFSSKREDSLDIIENIKLKVGPSTSDGALTLYLLESEVRNLGSDIIVRDIKKRLGPIYGVEHLTFGSGSHFGKPVSVAFLGSDMEELEMAKEELKSELNIIPALRDVMDNDPKGIKEINVKLKEKAYLMGLSLQDVLGQVRSGFFGKEVQRLQRGRDQVKIWVRYDENYRTSISNLDDMRITTASGDKIPFGEIASYEIERGIVDISHLDGNREVKVEADLMDESTSATDMMAEVSTNLVPEILAKYPSVSVKYEGQNREAEKTQKSAKIVLSVVFFLIFAVITFTFRSFGQTTLIMLLIPFSAIGVIWGHWLHGMQINILSALGIIALIGILVNDSLVFVSKLNSYLKEGMKFDDAIIQAGFSRFRPIFLTSLTTVAGLAPLIYFEKSLQAQFLIPMAISIAYGIAFATVLTLLLLPVSIKSFNSLKRTIHWIWEGEWVEPEQVERAIKELKSEKDAEEQF
ncbi:MAG: efflux RND transporter permease subunit [Flavobacteriales bacterium]|nr:efflux RND transporter permease subunit [Flavobacteriales bacterium]